jgi:phosphoribosylformimino-5-aminoimidazole carboxamide ribotide isomerase
LSTPELFPAVDILDGRAVRLVQGDFARSTEYAADPLAAAERWVSEGARRLHVVDLDGARAGRPVNLDHLRRIAAETEVPVQYGGGLRTDGQAAEALAAGASRIVIGTAAFADPALLDRLLGEDPAGVAVAIDVRGGRVATGGWTERTDLAPEQAVRELTARGVSCFVYTDVDRDGTLEGIAQSAFASVAEAAAGRGLVYSGGIGSLADLRALAAMELPNLEGAIAGKALYEQRFTVSEGRAVLAGAAP